MPDVSNYQAPPVDELNKGLGPMTAPWPVSSAAGEGWSLLDEEVSLPTAVLYESRLDHNLRWMQQFVRTYGLQLAPHGKTTMAPKLVRRQLDGGAWGITVATAQPRRKSRSRASSASVVDPPPMPNT